MNALSLDISVDEVDGTLKIKLNVSHATHSHASYEYEDFFAVVATKPAESYEKLLDLLPSVRNTQAHGTAIFLGLSGTQTGMIKPKIQVVHPMHKEWVDAAEAEYDDVPEEEGDWVDMDQEVLDEDGIPVESGVTRASSSCILDAPGAVHVDNFTEEEVLLLPSLRVQKADEPSSDAIASSSSKFNSRPLAGPSHTSLEHDSPSKIEGQRPASRVSGAVVTLEDEIKRMKAAGMHQAAKAALSHFYPPSVGQPYSPLLVGGPEVMKGPSDAIMSSESWKVAMSNALAPPPSTLQSAAQTRQQEGSLIEEEEDESQPIESGLSSGPDGHRGPPSSSSNQDLSSHKQQQTLPGECLATDSGVEAEEVDPFDSDVLLEDMGLKDRKEEEEPEEEEVEHLDLTCTPPNRLASCPTSTYRMAIPVEDAQVTVVSVPTTSVPSLPAEADETVTFEAVEKFSIDPSFDYDNVKLTPRGFPYNLRGNPAPPNFKFNQ